MNDLDTSQGAPSESSGASFDVDAALSAIESGQDYASPEPAATPDPAPADAATEPAAAAAPSELEFDWNGRKIKAPFSDPRIQQWAAKGYDYNQRMQAFKAEQETFASQRQEIEALKAKYAPVEEYYSKNPQHWEQVQQAFQNAQGLDPNNPLVQKLQQYEQKLSQVDQFIQTAQQREAQEKAQQEDQALDTEIQSLREQYKDLDWNGVDPEGNSLEARVARHAIQNGIKKFGTAFRDLYHDQLVKRAAEQAKESVTKERQKASKLGLLGQTPTPKKGITPAEDLKSKSYDQLEREALQELGLA